jgi:tripartite-type tricarboxylate transporter receptor subunit TctC
MGGLSFIDPQQPFASITPLKTNMTLKQLLWCSTFLGFISINAAAQSNTWPNKVIKIIVPFVTGSFTDTAARVLSVELAKQLGQTVIVDNKGGAGGALGAQSVARASNDGHTLLFATSTLATNAALESNPAFDAEKDFAAVALIGRGPIVVVVSKELGVKSLEQLIALAKPQVTLNYCSAGNGSINHLSAELFKQKTGVEMTHIPYKGSGPATLDLLAGRVQEFFSTVPTILPHIRQNSVELIAVTGAKRLALFPNTPTSLEAGIKDLDLSTWWGVLAPKGTPNAIVDKLNTAINAASAQEPLHARLVGEGASIENASAKEFQLQLGQEIRMWKSVVKSAGLKDNN